MSPLLSKPATVRLQADGAEFAAVLALLEFAFERPVAIPGAGDRERDAVFREYSGKSAAESLQMTRCPRIEIIGKTDDSAARDAAAGRSAVDRSCLRPRLETSDAPECWHSF